MLRRRFQFGCLAFGLTLVAFSANANAEPGWTEPLAPFFKDHCFSCHGGGTRRGGLDLEQIGTDRADPDLLRLWVRIHDRVAGGEMPPKDDPRPDGDATRKFLLQLSNSLMQADARRRQTVLRRLNRVEYENTVRDLFGVRVDVKEMLPKDPSSYGFDTVGEVLAISPEQMEVYLEAASEIVDRVFGPAKEPERVVARMPLGNDSFASRSIGQLFVKTDDDSRVMFQGNWCPSVFLSGQAKADGTYRVRIKAKAHQTDKPLVMAVYGGDVIVGRSPSHLVGYYDVAPGDEWTSITFDDFLEIHGCYLMKPYDLHAPTSGLDRFKGPGLMIGEVAVEGPLEAWPPVSRKKLLGEVDPKTAGLDEGREILSRLLPCRVPTANQTRRGRVVSRPDEDGP